MKPRILSKELVEQVASDYEALEKKNIEVSKKLSDLVVANGDLREIRESALECEITVRNLQKNIQDLNKLKEELTIWVTDFKKNKTTELNSEFNFKRVELEEDLRKIREVHAEEKLAIKEILAIQESNDNKVQRMAKATAKQQNQLAQSLEQFKLERKEIEESKKELVSLRKSRTSFIIAMETREKKFKIGVKEYEDEMKRVHDLEKSVDSKIRSQKSHAAYLNQKEADIGAASTALNQERATAKLNLEAAHVELKEVERKLNELIANSSRLVQREKKVASAERRMNLRG